MERKQRVTLDGAGLRLRPRTYADSHVPKRVTPRLMNDVSRIAHKEVEIVKSQPVEVSTQYAAAMARNVLDQRRVASHVDEIVSAGSAISSLVGSIQHNDLSIRQPANYESALMASEQTAADHQKDDRRTFGDILKSVFPTRKYQSVAMSAMALFLVVGGVVALASSAHSSRLVTMQVQALSEKSSKDTDASDGQNSSTVDMPSEDKIPESVVGSYSVAPDLPRYISIPKIKIKNTRVLRMGLDKDGAIKSPRNVWDTGWYDGSSKPVDVTGAALIVGHVSGPTNGGIFYNLYRLSVGDDINVTQGDGTVLNYKVVAKEEVPTADMNMNNYLISKNVDKAGLTLMTCAGEFNPKTQTYDKRLAVFAIRSN